MAPRFLRRRSTNRDTPPVDESSVASHAARTTRSRLSRNHAPIDGPFEPTCPADTYSYQATRLTRKRAAVRPLHISQDLTSSKLMMCYIDLSATVDLPHGDRTTT